MPFSFVRVGICTCITKPREVPSAGPNIGVRQGIVCLTLLTDIGAIWIAEDVGYVGVECKTVNEIHGGV